MTEDLAALAGALGENREAPELDLRSAAFTRQDSTTRDLFRSPTAGEAASLLMSDPCHPQVTFGRSPNHAPRTPAQDGAR